MPEKWKESTKDRKGNQTHYYLRNTPTDELQEALTKGNVANKKKHKARKELVRRGVSIAS